MTQEELQKTISTLADGAPVEHAGTLDDPIPQQLLYAKTGKDGIKKIYTVAAGVTIGGGGVTTNIGNATDTDKGVTFLSDAIDSDAAAADGFTAATPKAVKTALEEAKTYANNKTVGDATDKVKGIVTLTDATDDTSNAATGTKAATPLAVNKVQVELTTLTGTVTDIKTKQGELTSLTTNAKDTLVNAINEVNGKQLTVNDATDTIKGINKLSDALDSDLNAATGITAATPLAVKTVNDKLGNLDSLTTTAKTTLVDAINEVKATGGTGGSIAYVITPEITSPTNGAQDISTKGLTVIGTGYENVFASDLRKHRVFELAKSSSFSSVAQTKNVDADSVTFDGLLEAQTKYYVRIKDVSQKGRESAWSPVVSFTTSEAIHANTPTITLKGYADSPSDIGSGLTIEASEYSVSESQSDTHKATSWSIAANGRTNVWESLNDSTHKTSITVPKGTLQKDTAYTLTVIYHSTNFADSAPAVKQFTTSNDFGTVQPPVVTITGGNTNVSETPTISGGVFSNTREPDTHAATEIKVLLSENMSPVWEHTENSAATSLVVPKGKLQSGKQYKVQLRYKGTNFGWSQWGETTFTTTTSFIKYNYIGIPGTSTFGVGLAEEKDYKAVNLVPCEGTEDPKDFQYGLYGFCYEYPDLQVIPKDQAIDQGGVAMKWIPKFYIKQLQKNEGTVNLNDSELEALLPYVEVTKEQMKEAQRRSPHNALVVAPADKFTNEADANAHGFYLMRGFVDGGKEYNGFFIANTLTLMGGFSYDVTNKYAHLLGNTLLDIHNNQNLLRGSTNISTGYEEYWPAKSSQTNHKSNFIETLNNTSWQCCSVFAWAVISILSLIQGQYATSTSECAWYDPSLVKNFPKGINNGGTRDTDDASVTITPAITENTGSVFVTKNAYPKTTHNGSITGITNVNGWLEQLLIGSWGGGLHLLKKSDSIYDINVDNVNDKGASYYEKKDISRISPEWGGDKSSLPDLAGNDKDFFGIFSFGGNSSNNSNEFGGDLHYSITGNSAVTTSYSWNQFSTAGIFNRGSRYWISLHSYCGFRAMAYPSGRTVSGGSSGGGYRVESIADGDTLEDIVEV